MELERYKNTYTHCMHGYIHVACTYTYIINKGRGERERIVVGERQYQIVKSTFCSMEGWIEKTIVHTTCQ